MKTLPLLFALLFGIFAAQNALGEPQWIWSTAKANEKAGSRRWNFMRQFETAPVSKAILEVTADDQFEIRLNNRRVGRGQNWQQMFRYDVTQLVQDKNELVIRCQNGNGSPAGLVAKLTLHSADGGVKTISTDEQWKCRIVDNVNYRSNSEKSDQWKPVFAFGELFKANPWGKDIKLDAPIELVKVRSRKSSSNKPRRDEFELRDGDRVVFLGGTFIERAQNYGHIEYALTTAFPGRDLVFRNLGWSGDTVFGESRARFGTVEDGFEHLETHVTDLEPTVIFAAYGNNAAHTGPAGLQRFRDGYERLLDVLIGTGADVVLVGPHKYKSMPAPLPNQDAYNKNVAQYNETVKQLAVENNCRFIDLAGVICDISGRTDNGLHMNDRGYRAAAHNMLVQLKVDRPDSLPSDKKASLRKLIAEKNELYFHRWRPQNETYLFLFRKHEQGNNAVEIPQFDPLIAAKEKQITELTK